MRLARLVVPVFLVALIAGACSRGSYPVDIFREMHYQQSYKVQEPDRLDVPTGAVPHFQLETRETGEKVFKVNCSMCHGAGGRGDGRVLQTMVQKYGYKPVLDPDLKSQAVQRLTDEQLFQLISKGVIVMPPFEKLLTEEERHLLVQYLRQLP